MSDRHLNTYAAIQVAYPVTADQIRRNMDRAKALGVRFSPTAEHSHRAAILNHLENPGDPTLVTYEQMTWFTSDNPAHDALRDHHLRRICRPQLCR